MSSFTRPYARAFVEAAPKGYDFGAFLEAGDAMAHAFETNPKLRAFMLAPNVPQEAKKRAIEGLAAKAGMDAYGTRFLLVMLREPPPARGGRGLPGAARLERRRSRASCASASRCPGP